MKNKLFDRPNCMYLLPNGECSFDYVPCNECNQSECNIYNSLNRANHICEGGKCNMSRGSNKKLKDLLGDAIVLLDAVNKENRELVEQNAVLNAKVQIANTELEKANNRGLKQRILNIFS